MSTIEVLTTTTTNTNTTQINNGQIKYKKGTKLK